jgi:glucokinase
LREAILKVTDGDVHTIILGVPGVVDVTSKTFVKFPNYEELNSAPFDSLVADEFKDMPLYVDNDASLAGLAEAVLGAGKEHNVVAYVTLGTGVGIAKIEYKKLPADRKVPEPGHHIVQMDSEYVDGAGIRGSLEAFVSGSSFEKLFGVEPQDCDDESYWRSYGRMVGIGLVNIVAFWSPDVIVIGGGISNHFDLFSPSIGELFKEQNFYQMPTIKKSQLGDNAGVWGGFVMLRQRST